MSYDILIRNGRLVDGAGNPWFKADIAINEGKIVKIGRFTNFRAERIIDAGGLVVAPGITDVHTHSDTNLLVNPNAESGVRQGVTTEVIGNCGMSAAPLTDEQAKEIVDVNGLDVDWRTFGEYLSKLERQGIAHNVVPLIGHNTVRKFVMGMESRAPTSDELESMKALVAEAMEDGAFGMSTGLEYRPGCWANTKEVVELCKVVANYGGLYTTHKRNRDESVVEALKEAIEIGEKAGLRVNISHFGSRYPNTSEKVSRELISIAEDGRDNGVEVTADSVFPLSEDKFMGPIGSTANLPTWAIEGGKIKLIERLRDPEARKRIKEYKGMVNKPIRDGLWHLVYLYRTKSNPDLKGKHFEEIAKIKGVDDPFDAFLDILLEDLEKGELGIGLLIDRPAPARIPILKWSKTMISSDTRTSAPYGALKGTGWFNTYSQYPIIFRHFVREMKLLTLEDAVRKTSSLPAQLLRLNDRGLLREGIWADLYIFDLDKIGERTDIYNPEEYPVGIDYVLVNGVVVVETGKHTGALPGKVLGR